MPREIPRFEFTNGDQVEITHIVDGNDLYRKYLALIDVFGGDAEKADDAYTAEQRGESSHLYLYKARIPTKHFGAFVSAAYNVKQDERRAA